MAEVVVVGNVGIDTNVFLPGEDINFEVEANFTENLDYVGQAGGFSSRGFARLGRDTAFIGYVGDDHAGRFVREELDGDGVDLTGLFVDPAGTSRSVNLMYRDGRRKNFYDGKSHLALRPDPQMCRRVLAGARLALFHLPDWARSLLPVARDLGIRVACDLQDVVDPADPYRRDFVEAADILFLSAANHHDPRPVLAELARPGRIVVCGMGAVGCAVWAEGAVTRHPPVDIGTPVLDTNGAGDGLAVGFLVSHVLEGRGITESVRRAQITARYTCGQRADSSQLITAGQLDSYAMPTSR
jgi:sugar/nucleoside kinase (ribokinase family)